jgi:hypothetical protein
MDVRMSLQEQCMDGSTDAKVWMAEFVFFFLLIFFKKIEFIFLPIIYQEPGDGDAPTYERPVIKMAWVVAVI